MKRCDTNGNNLDDKITTNGKEERYITGKI